MAKDYHTAVMLDEVVQGLAITPTGYYADVTFGGGGHAHKIVERLSTGHLFAFDKDLDAANIAKNFPYNAFTFTRTSFRFLKEFLHFYGAPLLDGLLADLGTSAHQIDTPERGFSIRWDGVLDMRMDTTSLLTARTIVNSYTVQQLTYLLHHYGEISRAASIAKAIVKARNKATIFTTHQLRAIVEPLAPRLKVNQYLAKVFQALRIEVNHELDELINLLQQSITLIKPQGRMAIIAYHSLEDRLIKNFLNTGDILGHQQRDNYGNFLRPFVPLQKRAFMPSQQELINNNRARSARLRIGIRTA